MDIQNIIIQKIDLPQFIKDYAHVELSRKGNGWRCKCPIHENSVNPEAMYVDDRGGYYCFACNSGGMSLTSSLITSILATVPLWNASLPC